MGVSQALEGGFAFARKFVGMRAKAIDGLQRQRMSHKQMAGVATSPAGGTRCCSAPKWRDEALLSGRGGRRSVPTNRSSTAWRRRWELVFGVSNVDARHGVFWATLPTASTQSAARSGLHAVAAGLRGGRRGEGLELFSAWELQGASGPRSVTWYRSEVHESRFSPHIGEGVLAWSMEVGGPSSRVGAATRSPTRPSCVNTRSSTSSRGGKAWVPGKAWAMPAREGDSGRLAGK